MSRLIGLLFTICLSSSVSAAEINIDMLNKQGRDRNVYSNQIAYVSAGDTVFWKSKSKGHNVEFILKNGVPDGVKKFKSKLSKDAKYTFKTPGIYAYWCTPHKAMGMIGFVVVGKDKSNLAKIKKVKFVGKSKKLAKKLIAQLEQ
ncbi:MAG: pseudoazurin [Rhodospirillaceae bacterium]|nr:pseudoazurin [Rhodospirillaceae bacterium]